MTLVSGGLPASACIVVTDPADPAATNSRLGARQATAAQAAVAAAIAGRLLTRGRCHRPLFVIDALDCRPTILRLRYGGPGSVAGGPLIAGVRHDLQGANGGSEYQRALLIARLLVA